MKETVVMLTLRKQNLVANYRKLQYQARQRQRVLTLLSLLTIFTSVCPSL